MNIFHPLNLEQTMRSMHYRSLRIQLEMTEIDRDSNTYERLRRESNMIAAVTREFYEQHKVMPVDYYGFKSLEYLAALEAVERALNWGHTQHSQQE